MNSLAWIEMASATRLADAQELRTKRQRTPVFVSVIKQRTKGLRILVRKPEILTRQCELVVEVAQVCVVKIHVFVNVGKRQGFSAALT